MKIWLVSITLVVLLLLGVFALGSWLLYSPSGSEWLLTRVVTAQGGKIGLIVGTLGGRLQLTELQLNWPSGQLNCAKIELSTRLQQIMPLQLKIEQLHIENLLVEMQPAEQQAEQPLLLSWPELPWWLGLIEIDLQQLELVEFRLREKQAEQFRIEHLQTQALWRDHNLQLSQFVLQSPELIVEGHLTTGFTEPTLQGDLQIRHLAPESFWQQLSISTDLHAAEQLLLFGPINISLTKSQEAQLNVTGELGLGSESLQFQHLRLQRPNRPGVLTAAGSLHFASPVVGLNSRLQLSELDLQAETGQPIRLSGNLDVSGNLNNYRGNFKLTNRAENPLDINLSGAFSGGQSQLQLSDLEGHWLDGIIRGQAQIDWQQNGQVTAQITGRNFAPHLLHDQLDGEINLDLQADMQGTEQGPAGKLMVQLQESTLHGQPLTGAAELILDGQQLEIGALQLLGDGLQFQATGKLNEQIKLSWQIEKLEQLFSDFRGQLSGNGWFRLQPETLVAEFSSQGQQLSFNGWQLDNWQLQGKTLEDQHHWQMALEGKQLSSTQTQLGLENLHFDLTGALDQHEINLALAQESAGLQATLHGGLSQQSWQGNLSRLVGTDQQLGTWRTDRTVPLLLSADRLQLDPLEVNSAGHGSLLLQGYFLPPSQQAEGRMEWTQLDLGLLRPWLAGWDVAGSSSGSIDLQMAEEQSLHGQLTLQGRVKNEKLTLNLQQAEWLLDWNDQGFSSAMNLQLADGSQFEGRSASAEKAFFGWPQRGTLHLQGRNFSLTRLRPWLPPFLNLAGKLDWQTSGQWQTGQPWAITGDASIRDGNFFWQEDEETINTELSAATFGWSWQNQLRGNLELEFEDRGNIDARFELPLAAALPLQFDRSEPVAGELSARLQESGLLSILFPGRVLESRGQVKIDLQLAGAWEQPVLQGDARLFDAGAFLPTLGIQLSEINLHGTINENHVEVNTFRLVSAGGSLSGQGRMKLENWRPQDYQLQLKGERFQLVNLPELQIRVTPDLTVDGDMTQYKLRGTLSVPELLANNRKKAALAESSPDLVIVDAEVPPERRLRLKHDIDLQLILGEQVLLNSTGIDAKLAGRLRLQSNTRQELVAFGEVHVVKGKYASYGVSLDINRGNLFFNGGPLEQPTLDILALRKSGDVKAGVKVNGTPKHPVVQLYSEPVMVETDILSYIVLGRPIGAGSSQTGMLMTAAGALLSQGESAVLQEKLKNRLGLDVLDISAGDGEVSSSVITTGKYLSPDLYVSLGYSLFSNSNEMKVRYTLTPDWELESNIGTESGVDLFYKIDIK